MYDIFLTREYEENINLKSDICRGLVSYIDSSIAATCNFINFPCCRILFCDVWDAMYHHFHADPKNKFSLPFSLIVTSKNAIRSLIYNINNNNNDKHNQNIFKIIKNTALELIVIGDSLRSMMQDLGFQNIICYQSVAHLIKDHRFDIYKDNNARIIYLRGDDISYDIAQYIYEEHKLSSHEIICYKNYIKMPTSDLYNEKYFLTSTKTKIFVLYSARVAEMLGKRLKSMGGDDRTEYMKYIHVIALSDRIYDGFYRSAGSETN